MAKKKLIATVIDGECLGRKAIVIEINGGVSTAYIKEETTGETLTAFHRELMKLQYIGYEIIYK